MFNRISARMTAPPYMRPDTPKSLLAKICFLMAISIMLMANGVISQAHVSQTPVQAIITADNAYGFGYGTATSITQYYPSVENPLAGHIFSCDQGPETYTVYPAANDYLYLVTWSDDAVWQGVLGQFTSANHPPIYTGACGWEVYATGIDYDSGSGGPPVSSTDSSINTQIGIANGNGGGAGTSIGWVGVTGDANGNLANGNLAGSQTNTPPAVCGIDPAAQWMWYNASPGVLNAFTQSPAPNNGSRSTVGNGGHREYLIFRIPARSLVTDDVLDCSLCGEVRDLCDLGRDSQGNQIYSFTAPLSLSNADSCDLSVKMPPGAATISYGPTTLSSGTTQASGTFTVPPSATGKFCFELECKNGESGSCGKEVCVNLPTRASPQGDPAVNDYPPYRGTSTSNRHLDVSRFEVGAQFSSLNARLNSRTEPGVGGRLTYNVFDSLAFEAEANVFPRESPASEIGGGRVTQAFVGVKAGPRFGSFGVFGTVKPGVQSFGRAVTGYRIEREVFFEPTVGRKNLFALNLGGGVELCPAGRVGVRFGLGDTVTFHPSRESLGPRGPVRVPKFTEHNFQFSSGLTFRL